MYHRSSGLNRSCHRLDIERATVPDMTSGRRPYARAEFRVFVVLAATLWWPWRAAAFQPSPTSPYTFGYAFTAVSQERVGDGNYHASNCNSVSPNYFCSCTIGYPDSGLPAVPILHETNRTSSGTTDTVTIGIEYFVWNAYCNTANPSNINQPNSVNFYVELISVDENGNTASLFDFDPYWEHGTVSITINASGCPSRFYQARYIYQTFSGTLEVRSRYLGPYGRDANSQPCLPDFRRCPPPNPGRPVNPGSGNMKYEELLFSASESVSPVNFLLSYNSLSTVSSSLGPGFTHTFAQTLKPLPATNRIVSWINERGEKSLYRSGNPGVDPFLPMWPADAMETVNLNAGAGIYTLTDLNGTVTTFGSAAGEWRSAADRWGNTINGTYSSGNLITITDPEGRAWSLVYTSGKLSSITDPDSNLWSFSYDGTGHLQTIRDPLHLSGNPWRQYTYVTAGGKTALAQVQDDAPAVLEGHEYDGTGRAISSWSGDTVITGGVPHPGANAKDLVTLTYTSATQTTATSKIDSTTNQVFTLTYAYPAGRVLPSTVLGNCESCGGKADQEIYTYDAQNHPLTKVAGVDNTGIGGSDERVQTNYTYDSNGMVLSRTEAFGTGLERTTFYTYNYASGTPNGGPPWPSFVTSVSEKSVVQPAGLQKVTNYSWNTTGTRETTLTTSISGYLLSGDPQTTYTTTTKFDGTNSVKHRLLEVDGPAPNQKTVYTYYADTDSTKDRRGRLQTSSVYTSATAHLDTNSDNYDIFGTAKKVVDPNGVETDQTTDAKGRVLTIKSIHVSGDANEATDYTTTYAYDTRDRLTSVTLPGPSPLGNQIQYVYEDGTNP